MTGRPNWGMIAALSLLATTAVAIVILAVADDLAWLAALIFAFGLLEAYFLWRVMPRATGGTTQDELDRMNAEAEAAAEADDDWGEDA